MLCSPRIMKWTKGSTLLQSEFMSLVVGTMNHLPLLESWMLSYFGKNKYAYSLSALQKLHLRNVLLNFMVVQFLGHWLSYQMWSSFLLIFGNFNWKILCLCNWQDAEWGGKETVCGRGGTSASPAQERLPWLQVPASTAQTSQRRRQLRRAQRHDGAPPRDTPPPSSTPQHVQPGSDWWISSRWWWRSWR